MSQPSVITSDTRVSFMLESSSKIQNVIFKPSLFSFLLQFYLHSHLNLLSSHSPWWVWLLERKLMHWYSIYNCWYAVPLAYASLVALVVG